MLESDFLDPLNMKFPMGDVKGAYISDQSRPRLRVKEFGEGESEGRAGFVVDCLNPGDFVTVIY